ncbi:hypothetical protein [Halomicrobium katesii]|uniref:hypothetical protein n=1 Tax=Halomicrobium katesii TaxID=437163 RepID=UPI00037C2E2F|nr:hypothetical protein [Halomicrobium katesii]
MNRLGRRRFLTAIGAGATALAGCSALPSNGDDEPELDDDAIARAIREREAPSVPATNPLSVPSSAIEDHRTAARETLERVPPELSVPNGAVTEKLREQRARVADALDSSAEGAPVERLATWRDRRGDAVNVRQAYEAASGDADRGAYRDRYDEVRAERAAVGADLEYRAPEPVAATVGFATIESLLDTARGRLDPRSPFPEEPAAAVFDVGDRWEAVETAGIETADARRLRDAFVDATDDTPWRSHLVATSHHLGHSLQMTRDRVEEYVDAEASVLDADAATEPPTRHLFRQASDGVHWRTERAARARDRHDHATTVIELGRGLVAAETLDRIVAEIESGDYRTELTEETIQSAHASAVAAVEDAVAATPQPLAVPLATPAIQVVSGLRRRLDASRSRVTPERLQPRLDYAVRYARVVPTATAFVADRLAVEA